jgi:hypothetical protein
MAETAGLPEAVSGISKVVAPITNSVQAWLSEFLKTTKMDFYAEPVLVGILLFFLFIHFVVFVLTNNNGIQKFSKGLTQGLFETQVWLQTVVVKLIIYYATFILGLIQAVKNSSLVDDVVVGGVYFALYFVIYLLNKTALIFTGVRNPEYTLGPFSGTLTGIFTSSKNKWAYTPVIWLQTVTDIFVQQAFPGALFGYIVGKVAVAFQGGRLI